MQLAFNLLGILVVFGICWLLSWQRKSINWKLIGAVVGCVYCKGSFRTAGYFHSF